MIIIISIDLKNPQPLFEQVRDGFKKLIIYGALASDEKIPSVREMAQRLAINPNTIQKAYHNLEAEGYVYQVKGKGTFVTAVIPGENSDRINKLTDELQDIARELIYLGASKDQIKTALDKL